MARKESTGTLSKSDAVREYLAGHQATGVKQVAAALAEQGLDVSIALVNKIKYGDRKSLHRRPAGRKPPLGKAAGTKVRPGRRAQPRPARADRVDKRGAGGVSLEHLLAAKRLADEVGLDAAKKALEVLARLA